MPLLKKEINEIDNLVIIDLSKSYIDILDTQDINNTITINKSGDCCIDVCSVIKEYINNTNTILTKLNKEIIITNNISPATDQISSAMSRFNQKANKIKKRLITKLNESNNLINEFSLRGCNCKYK